MMQGWCKIDVILASGGWGVQLASYMSSIAITEMCRCGVI